VKNDHIFLTKEIISDAIKGATTSNKPAINAQGSNISGTGANPTSDQIKSMVSGISQTTQSQKGVATASQSSTL